MRVSRLWAHLPDDEPGPGSAGAQPRSGERRTRRPSIDSTGRSSTGRNTIGRNTIERNQDHE
jgi:hypothetical protein